MQMKMRGNLKALVLKVALVLLVFWWNSAAKAQCAARLYVATDGQSNWSGTLPAPLQSGTDGPLPSLDEARDRVRELRTKGCAVPPHVIVRGGTYRLKAPFMLTAADSGTQAHPVVYEAYAEERPIVSGGVEIIGWTKNAQGIWSVQEPQHITQLFVNGTRAQQARAPYNGYFRAEGKSSTEDHYQLHYRGDDIQSKWAGSGAEVVVLLAWAELHRPILSVDTVQHIATLAGPSSPVTREENARYWVENVPGEPLGSGEWREDERTHILEYKPPAEDESKEFVFSAPMLPQLLVMSGDKKAGAIVHDIEIRGLIFEGTDSVIPSTGFADSQAATIADAAIQIRDAKRIRLANCIFRAMGGYAVHIRQGSSHNAVVHNAFYDLGAGAVRVGEEAVPGDDALRVESNHVDDNDIHSVGHVYPSAVAIWVGQSSGNSIAHNHIHDVPYGAISVGWTWGYGPSAADHNQIEFNWIHDIGTVLSDLGGIYLLGKQPGTTVRNNLISNVGRFTYGGWGIYLDEGSSNVVVENNIVYDAESAGFHQHYGRDNIIRNNIFAFGHEFQLMRTRPEPWRSFRFEHNIVVYDQGSLLGAHWSEGGYAMDWNVYWDLRGLLPRFGADSWQRWHAKGYDLHSLIADPRFASAANRNFHLLPGSPAVRLGIHPIDMSTVGPRALPQ
jgi:parallel beta-helix repeat protein